MQKIITAFLNKPWVQRFIRFGIVGASGILVNSAALWLFHERGKIPLWLASPLAIAVAIYYNFTLNNLWTWRDSRDSRQYKYLDRVWRYYLSNLLGNFINYLILIVLSSYYDFYYLFANLLGIAAGMLSNFILSDKWVFKALKTEIQKDDEEDLK
ncbi:MAG TPA: GtrA family protein [Candidatus Marinimicrobia bacterium]|nr:GtrA family protein [Candidatus Neomarinimicrobiota bacterium]